MFILCVIACFECSCSKKSKKLIRVNEKTYNISSLKKYENKILRIYKSQKVLYYNIA